MPRAAPDRRTPAIGLTPDEGPRLERDILSRLAEIVAPPPDELRPDVERCEASLHAFIRGGWATMEPSRPFIDGWHIGCVAEHLQAVTDLEIQNLILATPPGFTKSLVLCVFWFAWTWARNPGFQWLYASYGGELSIRDQLRARWLIGSEWYQSRWGNCFRMTQEGHTKFSNDAMGFRIATSVAGRGTGEHVDAAVIDDALKAIDAGSRVKKERVRQWWDETMPSRGNNPATFRRVVSGQRLAEDDLTGYLLSGSDPYETLILPMEYEPKRYFFPESAAEATWKVKEREPAARKRDVIVPTTLQRRRPDLLDPRREDGDLLWPAMFPRPAVDALKKTLHTAAPGQLQQRPTAAEGEIYKTQDFRYFVEETDETGVRWVVLGDRGADGSPAPRVAWDDLRFFQTCDTALEADERSDYTALCTWALAQRREDGRVTGRWLLLFEAVQLKLTVPQQWPFLVRMRRKWPGLILQAVEKKASGHGLIQGAAAEGLPLYALNPGTRDKVARSSLMAGLYREHLVFHRAGMDGLVDYEDVLVNFPNSSYLDLADCAAYAAILYTYEKILTSNVPGDLILNGADHGELGTTREVPGGQVTAVAVGAGGEPVEVFWPDEDEATGWGSGR